MILVAYLSHVILFSSGSTFIFFSKTVFRELSYAPKSRNKLRKKVVHLYRSMGHLFENKIFFGQTKSEARWIIRCPRRYPNKSCEKSNGTSGHLRLSGAHNHPENVFSQKFYVLSLHMSSSIPRPTTNFLDSDDSAIRSTINPMAWVFQKKRKSDFKTRRASFERIFGLRSPVIQKIFS